MEVVGVSPVHTSVPRGGGFAAGGTEHLVVCAHLDARSRELLAALTAERPGPIELLCAEAPAAPLDPSYALTVSGSVEALEALVSARLADATVGMRLHLVGHEGFVRRVSALGWAAGLLTDEIGTDVVEELAFRVFCVHCRALTEPVAETLVPCAGCGRTLTVYHHFSRRKGAYMGFQADAELAGDLPAARSGPPCP